MACNSGISIHLSRKNGQYTINFEPITILFTQNFHKHEKNCKYFSGGGNFTTHTQLLKGFVSLLLVTSATLTSCNSLDEDSPTNSNGQLNISVGVYHTQSRTIITDGYLPDGSKIGVMLDDGDATSYDGYNNVVYTADGTGDSQTWSSTIKVALNSTAATLYAYYPWASGTDITAIPIETESQTDYLYGTPIENVSAFKADNMITLNHALANVNITFERGVYAGTGDITQVAVQSAGLAAGGTFNAKTGEYSAFKGEGNAIVQNLNATLDGDAIDIMAVPTGANAAVIISVLIDGKVYNAIASAKSLQKGNSYLYTLSFTESGMTVGLQTVTAWTNNESGSLSSIANSASVYAVAADGKLVDYENADESCIAVALVAEGGGNSHKFWIEKYENLNSSYENAQTTYGKTNTEYAYFSWGGDGKDQEGIESHYYIFGEMGYIENFNSTLTLGDEYHYFTDNYNLWTNGALSDFNGKQNSEVIKNITDNGTAEDNCTPMGVLLNTFNASVDNGGYSDWYIPSLGQAALIYINLKNINKMLTKIGGKTIISFDEYWTSTECNGSNAWYFYDGGGLYKAFKKTSKKVRFVRDID